MLRPLLELGSGDFYSLQKDYRSPDDRALALSMGITDLASEIGDFDATAGLVAELDLVISVDTSMAHLAGALGRRVWVLLPYCPDWRWLLQREDSPWYPNARLFRQERAGDWMKPVEAIRAALAHLEFE
jgi:ADP-heptose:LPS heptosyltransferase